MHMGIQVVIEDPDELERIRARESDITKERIQKILGAGANVVLTTKGIDDMSLKYFVEAGAIACRRVPKEDLRCVLWVIHRVHCDHARKAGLSSFFLLQIAAGSMMSRGFLVVASVSKCSFPAGGCRIFRLAECSERSSVAGMLS